MLRRLKTMFRSILVCSDGSDSALQAARVAADLARKLDACLYTLNVMDDSLFLSPDVGAWQAAVNQRVLFETSQQEQQEVERRTLAIFESANAPCEALREFG